MNEMNKLLRIKKHVKHKNEIKVCINVKEDQFKNRKRTTN